MISIERCKEIIGEKMSDSEAQQLRDSLYAVVDSILDNYFEEFVNISKCKKQSYIAESHRSNKALKDTGSKVRSIAAESMLVEKDMMS